jgi:hypothetical protein
MAVTLNASTTTGLVQSADTSGTIELQNNGTTRLTVNSSGATIPTATVTTLNTPTGVLATQNGMTGIAKAWVNWSSNGTVTINSSFNVSSVTRTGTGLYTITFTTAFPSANYCAACAAGNGGTNTGFTGGFHIAPTTTTYGLQTLTGGGSDINYPYNSAVFFCS